MHISSLSALAAFFFLWSGFSHNRFYLHKGKIANKNYFSRMEQDVLTPLSIRGQIPHLIKYAGHGLCEDLDTVKINVAQLAKLSTLNA